MKPAEPRKLTICPSDEENPRNSEGAMARLDDGRLFFAYSNFYGGKKDNAPARISAKTSTDDGHSWSDPFVVVHNEGGENVMSVSLAESPSGDLLLFYLRKNSRSDCRVFLRRSSDGAKSWSEPAPVCGDIVFHVLNNDRVIRLSGGRLLAPVAYTIPDRIPRHQFGLCYMSDDDGLTWRKGRGHTDAGGAGAMEPGLVELRDGRVLMFIRTTLGQIYRSFSSDGGETWSPAEPTGLASPESPSTIKRIPSTGDLLLIWNDNYSPGEPMCGRRTPLATAISDDEGEIWRNRRLLENEPDWGYCYTSVLFDGGKAYLTYCAAPYEKSILSETRLTVLDIDWFYQ